MPAKKGNKYAIGNNGGRPTKYSPELLEKTKEYIQACEDEETERIKTEGDKSTTYQLGVNVKLPSIEGLALALKVSVDSISRYCDENEEFCGAIEDLRKLQAVRLINNGLGGTYNPTIAKLLLIRHGYVERTELTGKDGEKLIDNEMSYERAKAIIAGEGSHTSDSKK